MPPGGDGGGGAGSGGGAGAGAGGAGAVGAGGASHEGGVHVDEWGEDLAYVVKTNGSADHCTVTSVEAETTK